MEKTCKLLIEHFNKYPEMQIVDIFKFLHQSSFGCEHLVSSLEAALEYVVKEKENSDTTNGYLTENLDGNYCRVGLGYLDKGLSAQTLAKIFYLSAALEKDGREELENKLSVVKELIHDKKLPFASDDFSKELEIWRENGFAAVRHSQIFRENYFPAYRVVANKYVRILPLLTEIDKALERGNLTLAIDGKCGSGKTTLAGMLSDIYDCNVFHVDDFFLRPEQRTKERFAEVGGNFDRERFLEEILLPVSQGLTVNYRKFDCSKFMLSDEIITVLPKKLTVIEGSYSMHKDIANHYDLCVFLDISQELQAQRIKKRNSKEMAERFFNEWIPLENVYFEKMQVKERCDIVLEIG